MDTKTTLEEMDRKAQQEIKIPQHQAEPQKKEERLFPALFITEDLKAVVGMDETLKGYMKDLKETDSTLSQTMEKIKKLRSDYTSLYGEMEQEILAVQMWGDTLHGVLETCTLDLMEKLDSMQQRLQDREQTIIYQTSETQRMISSLDKALTRMAKTLEAREKAVRKLLRIALIPASLLALLMVADIVLRLIFR